LTSVLENQAWWLKLILLSPFKHHLCGNLIVKDSVVVLKAWTRQTTSPQTAFGLVSNVFRIYHRLMILMVSWVWLNRYNCGFLTINGVILDFQVHCTGG
jgi:hypothetical protein